METIINRNTSLQIQEQEFKSDRERILDIMKRNDTAKTALLDWAGLGQNKQKVLNLVETTNLEVIKL